MSGAEWDAIMREIEALLENNNEYVSDTLSAVQYMAAQQAATEQTIETMAFLIVGCLAAIIAFMGVKFGARIAAEILEVGGKWL